MVLGFKRQTKRFTPVPISLDWEKLKRLASGCQGDYIPKGGEIAVRLAPVVQAADRHPVAVLQTGLHVFFFNHTDKVFESRVLKTDKQVHFLYALQEGKVGEGNKEPFAVRLYDIEEVVSGGRATRICEQLLAVDDYLNDQTVLVLLYGKGAKDMAFVTSDKVVILLSPPGMRLMDTVKEVVEISKNKFATDLGDEEGVQLADKGRYLDAARIGQISDVFFEKSKVDLELTLSSVDDDGDAKFEKKKPIAHTLFFPMEPSAVAAETGKLMDRLGILPAVDVTRLNLVMYEMLLHRQWISPSMRLFPGGLYNFLKDPHGIDTFYELSVDAQRRLLEIPRAPRRTMDVHYYCFQALKSTILAVRHLLSLEEAYASADKGHPVLPEDVSEGLTLAMLENGDDEEAGRTRDFKSVFRLAGRRGMHPAEGPVRVGVVAGDQEEVFDEEEPVMEERDHVEEEVFDEEEPVMEERDHVEVNGDDTLRGTGTVSRKREAMNANGMPHVQLEAVPRDVSPARVDHSATVAVPRDVSPARVDHSASVAPLEEDSDIETYEVSVRREI